MNAIFLFVFRLWTFFFPKKEQTPTAAPAAAAPPVVVVPTSDIEIEEKTPEPAPTEVRAAPQTLDFEIRSDGWGDGNYNAGRGERMHRGLDLIAPVGATVVATRMLLFERAMLPYSNDARFYGGLFKDCETGEFYKIFYIFPFQPVEGIIKSGDRIGTVQAIVDRYPADERGEMQNHIHVERLAQGRTVKPILSKLPFIINIP
jgi:hypothetical protein